MILAKAVVDGYVETGAFAVLGSGERPSWSQPVVGGKHYIRERDHTLCYDIRATAARTISTCEKHIPAAGCVSGKRSYGYF